MDGTTTAIATTIAEYDTGVTDRARAVTARCYKTPRPKGRDCARAHCAAAVDGAPHCKDSVS
jgi:hypothetical protein